MQNGPRSHADGLWRIADQIHPAAQAAGGLAGHWWPTRPMPDRLSRTASQRVRGAPATLLRGREIPPPLLRWPQWPLSRRLGHELRGGGGGESSKPHDGAAWSWGTIAKAFAATAGYRTCVPEFAWCVGVDGKRLANINRHRSRLRCGALTGAVVLGPAGCSLHVRMGAQGNTRAPTAQGVVAGAQLPHVAVFAVQWWLR